MVDKATMFANVQHHNGIEALRRPAKPINEDKAIVRRDLLAAVTNPKGASSIEKIEAAIEEWDTNIRLFVAADGDAPTGDMKRLTLIQMLPMEIAKYISMHEPFPEYKSFDSLKRFVFKYIRTLRSLKRAPRAAHLLQEQRPPQEDEDQEQEEEELMARLLASALTT